MAAGPPNEQGGTETLDRAQELQHLVASLQPLLSNFVRGADIASGENGPESDGHANTAMEIPPPEILESSLNVTFPNQGQHAKGVLDFASRILGHSVNTWNPGFMSNLYSSTNAVGVVSEMILAVLNTNVHVYETSPALSVVEKKVTKALACMFGLSGEHAGGVSQQGGSAANLTALVTARNTMFPEMKDNGTSRRGKSLVLFTSAGGHYSLEKAAQVCGLGSLAVWSVPVDSQGRMDVDELSASVKKARKEGYEPFFVNATAGTTVLGAYDPLTDIARVCRAENLWMHIDASWGGGVVFSSQHRRKVAGSELADSITFNPHKMLNVPLTCSFLLVADLRQLWKSSTLPASYLFHNDTNGEPNGTHEGEEGAEVWDIADMTLQCGRRGDSLKMALGWMYYGTLGYQARVDHAFSMASKLASLVNGSPSLVLVSDLPPPCLSVCFYYAAEGKLGSSEENTTRTKGIVKRLRAAGFAVEHAVGDQGRFLRAVVGLQTPEATVERLVREVVKIGRQLDA